MIRIEKVKTATLELDLWGDEKLLLTYPLDNIEAYKQVARVIEDIGLIETMEDPKTKADIGRSIKASTDVVDSIKGTIKTAIGKEWKKLEKHEINIPLASWAEILVELMNQYAGYFNSITSTEGEL